jgi:chromosomal replication initiator protein
MEKTPRQIWEAVLSELQTLVNKPNYRTWLAKTHAIGYEKDRFIIGVPNTFVAEYLDKNQRSLIEKVLSGVIGKEVLAKFRVDDIQTTFKSRNKPAPAEQASMPLLNPKYTLDSFVSGHSNQLAFAAAIAVAQNPGLSYNPLFIYGGSGLGKTHLLHAIGHNALEKNMKVLYVCAEEYTNQLMQAFKEKKTEEFRYKYRSADVLLLDDVQFFCGKVQTEENFFHTFDDLHSRDHQIVITCDRPPKSLASLQAKLRSRFEGGLVADIQEPDFDTRLAILQAKASQKNIEISADVLETIALEIKQNVRALEGSLNRVMAYAKVLTPEIAAQALKDLSGSDLSSASATVTPGQIMEAVVKSFNITPSDLRGSKRDESTALARHVLMYLTRQMTDYSLSDIGKELGGRSPATVSHAYQKIAEDINNNPSLNRKILGIQQEIKK